jgi:glyoxylase-like metal-dependent hydrolase (beta-lactamase superfamily II)
MIVLGNSIFRNKTSFPVFEADEVINSEINLSENIKVIQTPGHTLASQSLIVDNELAYVGDAMFGVIKNNIFPPFADDVESMIFSWKKLYDTGCQTFYPGHGQKIERALLQKQYLHYSHKFKLDLEEV